MHLFLVACSCIYLFLAYTLPPRFGLAHRGGGLCSLWERWAPSAVGRRLGAPGELVAARGPGVGRFPRPLVQWLGIIEDHT